MLTRRQARSARRGKGAKANLFAIRRKVFHGARCRRGGVALEFAFALPVLLLFIFGVFELGRALWTQTTLEYAVEEAARYAIVRDSVTTQQIDDFARTRLSGLSTTNPPLSFNIVFETDANGDRTFVSVAGTYRFAFVTAFIGFDPIDLTANTRMSFVR